MHRLHTHVFHLNLYFIFFNIDANHSSFVCGCWMWTAFRFNRSTKIAFMVLMAWNCMWESASDIWNDFDFRLFTVNVFWFMYILSAYSMLPQCMDIIYGQMANAVIMNCGVEVHKCYWLISRVYKWPKCPIVLLRSTPFLTWRCMHDDFTSVQKYNPECKIMMQ